VRYYLGVAYAAAKQTDDARRALGGVPPAAREYADARLHLAHMYQRGGDVDAAVVVLREGVGQRKHDPDMLGMLASLYREKKEFAAAERILEGMVERDPTSDRLRFTLGALYDEDGKRDKAIAEMRRAIELNPRNAAALNYLGYTYAEMAVRLDEAEDLVRRALEIEPDEGFYVDSLGWIYYQRGDYPMAVKHLENAVELSGNDPTISEHLADAYHKVGRSGDALRLYRQALEGSQEPQQIERLERKIAVLARAEKAERGVP
jgi:Flp pilus assembly protein TadD